MDPSAPSPDASVADARELARSVLRLAGAWRRLLDAELALAGRSLRALAVGALLAPVLLAGAWFSLIALLLVALHSAGLGWLGASALACALQGVVLWLLFRAARRWARDASLQRTRAALARLLVPSP